MNFISTNSADKIHLLHFTLNILGYHDCKIIQTSVGAGFMCNGPGHLDDNMIHSYYHGHYQGRYEGH